MRALAILMFLTFAMLGGGQSVASEYPCNPASADQCVW